MKKNPENPGSEKPDEFGVFSEEYCRVNDFLAEKIGTPVWARVMICWRIKDLKPGVSALPPMQAFAVLFGDLVSKLIESGTESEDLKKLYDLSVREKIDLFLSEDIPSALFDLSFSDRFIATVCSVLNLKNTALGKVRSVAEEIRGAVVKTSGSFGTSWIPVSMANEALVESDEVKLVDTLRQDNGSKGAASFGVENREDIAFAPTCVMGLDGLEDVLKKPRK